MSAYHFLVEVDIERESGKFASRDDISEAIAEALNDAPEQADLSSLGADSDSTYSVVQTDVTYMEKKELKDAYARYDAAVIAELPGDPELRADLKHQKTLLAQSQRHLAAALEQIEMYKRKAEEGKTDVYISERDGIIEKRTYLPDGKWDRVTFVLNGSEITVGLREEKSVLEIRQESMHRGNMAFMPRSGNEVHMVVVPR